MQQIPLQLASGLDAGVLITGKRVSSVTRNAGKFEVAVDGGHALQAQAVVLAVAGDEGNALLSGVSGWRAPEVAEWNKTTAFCYATEHAPVSEPIILLNGEGRAGGPVNNVAVMSAVCAGYAPPGAHLVVASVVGQAPTGQAALARLDEAVRSQLKQWFSSGVTGWSLLRAFPLAHALPRQRHAEWEQSPVRVAGSTGVYLCGDYRETASIQGALASGRRAAQAVIADRAKVAP